MLDKTAYFRPVNTALAWIGRQLAQMKVGMWIVLVMHGYLFTTAIVHRSYLTDDSIQYLTIAENMADAGVYSQGYAAPLVADHQRTPGYPVFLYLMGRNQFWILLVQHALVLLSGWLLYRILLLHYGPKWAFYGSMLYLLQPYPAIFASYILSETLFIFLLLGWFYFYLRFWRGDGWIALCIAMLSLCLAVLVRPVAYPLLIVACVIALLQAVKLRRQMIPQLALIVAVPLLLLGPWLLRNHRDTGQFSMSTMGAMSMLHGRLGGLEASRQGLGTDEQHLYMLGDSIAALEVGLGNLRTYPANKQTHETEQIASGLSKVTLSFFWSHPWDAFLFQVRCFLQMFKGVGYGWARDLTHSSVAAFCFAGLQLGLNILSYLGLVIAVWRRKQWRIQERLAFWTTCILLVVSATAWADGRYRVVVDPMLVLLMVFVVWNYERMQATVTPKDPSNS